MKQIMLDLETLDTSPSALVVSIGAVAFDPMNPVLGDEFYLELSDLRIQQVVGNRTISADTVSWWMQQDAMAKQVFAPCAPDHPVRARTVDALEKFALFIGDNGGSEALIWGNGADFDNIILGSLYESFGFKKPWSYSRNRCFRTLKSLAPFVKVAREGTHHNALDDAITQVRHLHAIAATIKFADAPGT